MLDISTLNFDKGNGLVTVVAQDARTGAVLMVAHADREALERTLATGEMHYRSRTRGLWHKGATSGNVQRVESLTADCDGDAVLARVVPAGPACHTGMVSCFGSVALRADALGALDATIARRMEGVERGEGEERRAREAQRGEGAGGQSAGGQGVARGAPPETQRSTIGTPPHHHSAAPRTGLTPAPSSTAATSARPSYTQRLLTDRNLRLKKLGEEAAELVLACADGDRARAAEEAADLVYHTLVAVRPLGLSLDDLRAVLARRAAPAAKP
jgi:phosphoribosyl-ATP pyrophosphohydrolase/phosphoribosyl-AMP cyclohydrolase